MGETDFGYPGLGKCNRCTGCALKVRAHYRQGSSFRLMLIGQDPTISQCPDRVKEALMLDEANGNIRKWLRDILGANSFDAITLYGTNAVKCTFDKPPTAMGGFRFLKRYFENCRSYLIDEVARYRPSCVISLGEPTHLMFSSLLDAPSIVPQAMRDAFTGRFVKVSLQGFKFDYSPCLHIKTFRVAETYGRKVHGFKSAMRQYFGAKAADAGGRIS